MPNDSKFQLTYYKIEENILNFSWIISMESLQK